MFILIVGCSPTGYHLAKRLLVEGNEVMVLEKNLARCQMMWDEMGSIIMQGDGSDPVDLKRAGAARADTLVAVTDRDETNLVVCQVAKHVFSVEKTVATIKDHKNQPIFRMLGVDSVVNLPDLVLNSLEQTVLGSGFNHLATLRNPGSFLVSVTVPADAALVGKTLSDVKPNTGLEKSCVTLVMRGGEPRLPGEDLVYEAEDEVFAITTADEEQTLYDQLTGV